LKNDNFGVALENNFGKQLQQLRGSFSSFGKQLFGAAFDTNFGERLWGIALWNSFWEQLLEAGAVLRSNFGEQLSGTAL
jgi:hypothetical protein